MREAVIVCTARTPIGRAFRGAFNDTHGAVLAGHAVEHAVARAGIDPGEIEDVTIGCGLPEGATGNNIARLAAIRAGLPDTSSAVTVNRYCASGLQAIAQAAQRVIVDGVPAAVAGGVESISLVQNDMNTTRYREEQLMEQNPALWMSILDTAEIVAARYCISRETQDEYACESQRRTAAAQDAGLFDDEIVPLPATMLVTEFNGTPANPCSAMTIPTGSAFTATANAASHTDRHSTASTSPINPAHHSTLCRWLRTIRASASRISRMPLSADTVTPAGAFVRACVSSRRNSPRYWRLGISRVRNVSCAVWKFVSHSVFKNGN